MPRNVRPSWCDLAVDHVSNSPQTVKGTGPRSRSGTLSASFKVRSDGSVLDLLSVDMIASANGETVGVVVTDRRTGRVLFSERFAQ